MINWMATGFLLFRLWASAVGFPQAVAGCLWVVVRKALPNQKRLAKWMMPQRRIVEVSIAGYNHPFYARWPASDLHILHTIVRQKEYAPIADLLGESDEITFVDLGANIGAAARYFLQAFPRARVISVEPDPGNLSMCRRNLSPFLDRVEIIEAAVWNKNTVLTFETNTIEEGTEAGVQVQEHSIEHEHDRSVRAIDIPTLLRESRVPESARIAMKIDIEGSEQELFSGPDLDWLDRIDCLAIELHDISRKDCSWNFFSAVDSRLATPPLKVNDTIFVCLKSPMNG